MEILIVSFATLAIIQVAIVMSVVVIIAGFIGFFKKDYTFFKKSLKISFISIISFIFLVVAFLFIRFI